MDSMAFTFPIKSGMVERGMKFIEEMGTERADHHHDVHKSHGFKLLRMWYQTQPIEAVVIYLEADDVEAALKNLNESSHDFDAWFFKEIAEISGEHPSDIQTTLLIDWHHEHRHRHVIKAARN